jgi:hypothetical protein
MDGLMFYILAYALASLLLSFLILVGFELRHRAMVKREDEQDEIDPEDYCDRLRAAAVPESVQSLANMLSPHYHAAYQRSILAAQQYVPSLEEQARGLAAMQNAAGLGYFQGFGAQGIDSLPGFIKR